MSTVALDVDAVRARFSALDGSTAYFDAPGGTQCPDSVIDAIAELLAKAERDCFVGASLVAKPSYRWIVNGRQRDR